jgi:prepilin signal peptidase PulO-like enzyme (type II secretory pathway)
VPSFPHAPFLACGALPPLRFGQFFLDEAEHFLKIESPASLRSEGVRVHPGMPFGFSLETAFGCAGILTIS